MSNNRLGTGGVLTTELSRLMFEMWTGHATSLPPALFKKCINATKPAFGGHDQQDAQEFLVELLDTIHEDLNNKSSKPPSATSSITDTADGASTVMITRPKRTYSMIGPSLDDELASGLTTDVQYADINISSNATNSNK